MKKNKLFIMSAISSLLMLCGCSSGDLRAFNDAMSESNGYTVTYSNQSDSQWIGDIKWTTGIYNGSGYMKLKNSSDYYCKVRITNEDDTIRIFRLQPYQSKNNLHMSIYNQATYAESVCNTTSAVYQESF